MLKDSGSQVQAQGDPNNRSMENMTSGKYLRTWLLHEKDGMNNSEPGSVSQDKVKFLRNIQKQPDSKTQDNETGFCQASS